MSTPTTEQAATMNPQWRRFGRGTVVPILLLVALLVLLGQMHMDLASGYTAPRMVGDEQGGIVFYHGGNQGFFYTRTDDGQVFGKKRWSHGTLADATITADQLVTLYADKTKKKYFYSIYMRNTLERVWSGEFNDPDLALDHPRHLATLKGQVYAFGTDPQGALRVARLTEGFALAPVAIDQPGNPVLEGAAVLKDAKPLKKGTVPPPVLFTSADDGERLTLFWRVEREEGRLSQGEVRWTTFDGAAFGEIKTLPADLVALCASADPAAPPGARVSLFGVPYRASDSKIRLYRPGPEGFAEAETIAYEREGLTGGVGISHLAWGQAAGHTYLFAQIGTTIRYCTKTDSGWSAWEDFARRPAEQTAVIYGWFGSLMFLSGLLIYRGVVSFRRRRRPRKAAAPATPTPDVAALGEPATLWERAVAFSIDLGLVSVVAYGLANLFPEVLERAASEPSARLALATWFVVSLLGYFIVFEALFARTPGKKLMDLEVQDVDGGHPGWSAMIYRNLFRIELLVPPPYLVPLLSLLVMISTEHNQRPGDLVARTAVRRVPAA